MHVNPKKTSIVKDCFFFWGPCPGWALSLLSVGILALSIPSPPPPIVNPLTNLQVVLVEPANTGNIGATARVLKNTGISQLVLVNPPQKWDTLRTRWLAHASGEILDSCQIFPDLASAVADTHLVIGTTHRTGRGREVISTPRKLISQIAPQAFHHRIALVFGREKDGLWREELLHCHHLVRFPSAVLYPSFNLSHAVLLLTYEFFLALQEAEPAPPQLLATADERERLLSHLFEALGTIDFKPHNDDPANFSRVVRRFFNKTKLDKRDIRVIHRVLGQIRKFASRFPHSSSID